MKTEVTNISEGNSERNLCKKPLKSLNAFQIPRKAFVLFMPFKRRKCSMYVKARIRKLQEKDCSNF